MMDGAWWIVGGRWLLVVVGVGCGRWVVAQLVGGGWWVVAGGWWVVVGEGEWWLVADGWWLVAGGWWVSVVGGACQVAGRG